MKRIIKKSMYLMALLVFLAGCGNVEVLTKEELNVEFGKAISTNIKDYLNTEEMSEEDVNTVISEGQLVIESDELVESQNYQKVGSYTVKISYDNNEYDVVVNVQDTVAPQFVEFKSDLETYTNEKIDFSKIYKAEDLSEVTISVDDSKVDYSTAGTYNAVVTAKDIYDNEETKEVSISVKEKPAPKPSKPTSSSNKSNTSSNSSSNKSNSSASSSSSSSSSNQSTDRKPQGGKVWISETGKKYHSIPNCGRMNPNKASQVSVSDAEGMGLSPCSKCM